MPKIFNFKHVCKYQLHNDAMSMCYFWQIKSNYLDILLETLIKNTFHLTFNRNWLLEFSFNWFRNVR